MSPRSPPTRLAGCSATNPCTAGHPVRDPARDPAAGPWRHRTRPLVPPRRLGAVVVVPGAEDQPQDGEEPDQQPGNVQLCEGVPPGNGDPDDEGQEQDGVPPA